MSKKKKNFILAGIISVLAMMIILVPAYVVSSGKPYSEGAGIDSEIAGDSHRQRLSP